jgi:hypothetical protein
MNAFNRLVMLIIALLLLVVPILVLLVGLGVISSQMANTYTGYQSAASAIGSFSLSGLSNTARIIAGVVSALVAIIALILIFRELTPGRRPAKQVTLNREAGKETKITAKGVRSLAEGAAREAGGASPKVSLASKKKAYKVGCKITIPGSSNYTGVAERARDKIRQVLDNQSVPVKEVEVTVEGADPGSESQNA